MWCVWCVWCVLSSSSSLLLLFQTRPMRNSVYVNKVLANCANPVPSHLRGQLLATPALQEPSSTHNCECSRAEKWARASFGRVRKMRKPPETTHHRRSPQLCQWTGLKHLPEHSGLENLSPHAHSDGHNHKNCTCGTSRPFLHCLDPFVPVVRNNGHGNNYIQELRCGLSTLLHNKHCAYLSL